MDGYALLVFTHVLLFVYWLGADLGVFYVSFRVLDRGLPAVTRAAMARVLLDLDLAPRICLVLTLPVGLTLAGRTGLSPLDGAGLVVVWIAALAWLGVVVTIHLRHGTGVARVLVRGDGALRGLLVVVLAVLVVTSLVTGEPFRTPWLAAKVALYATALACGLAIRVVLRPFGPAVAGVVAAHAATPAGSGDDADRPAVADAEAAEAALASSLRRTYPLVVAIWLAIAAAAYLGVAQPS